MDKPGRYEMIANGKASAVSSAERVLRIIANLKEAKSRNSIVMHRDLIEG
jgi:hypothetical protein